jgi:hypothetical protein
VSNYFPLTPRGYNHYIGDIGLGLLFERQNKFLFNLLIKGFNAKEKRSLNSEIPKKLSHPLRGRSEMKSRSKGGGGGRKNVTVCNVGEWGGQQTATSRCKLKN